MSTTTVDNGVNTEALLGARDALSEAPEAAQFTWKATSEWITGTHSRQTIEHFPGLGAAATGMSVYDLVLEKKLLTREQLDEILKPEVLTQPRAFRVKAPGEVHALTKRRGQAD